MQLDFFLAPDPRVSKGPATQPATKRVVSASGVGKLPTPAAPGLTVAELLNRGDKVEFPKNANAVRATIGSKTIVILKADADTLKGAGVATTVEFGTVRNDAKGHPVRKDFAVLVATQSAEAADNGELFGGEAVCGK